MRVTSPTRPPPGGSLSSGANGAAFADYDNDGDADLVLVGDGSDVLLRNDGDRHFTDVSAAAGIGDDDRRGISASWGDFDADGHLDLYVTNYMRCTGEWETEEDIIANVAYFPDTLYRNNGDGTFTDVTSRVRPGDYDDSTTRAPGSPRRGSTTTATTGSTCTWRTTSSGCSPDHNRLWRNDGPASDGGWRFTDVSDESGTAFLMNTMGIGSATSSATATSTWLSPTSRRTSTCATTAPRSSRTRPPGSADRLQQADTESITWGGGFHDLNLDGWEDLYFAAGNFLQRRPRGRRTAQRAVRERRHRRDVPRRQRGDRRRRSRPIRRVWRSPTTTATATSISSSSTRAERRACCATSRLADSNHWLEVDTVGTVSNRDGCGALVIAETSDSDDDPAGDVRFDQRRLGQSDARSISASVRPTGWSRSRLCGPRVSASGSPTSPSTASSPSRRLATDGPRRDAAQASDGRGVRRRRPGALAAR